MELCRPVGAWDAFWIIPGALPQADMWLPHSGRNRSFALVNL